jgi:2-aminoadipate transaminase
VETLLAERARWLKASDVRELLKYTQDPEIISFAGGLPSPEAFPRDELRVIFKELLREDRLPALQYGPTPGDPALRRELTSLMAHRAIDASPDRTVVTHGAQQALEFLGRVLLDPGDVVIVTRPTYLGIFTALATYRPTYHGVPLDEEGILTDALEEDLKALAMDGIRPKFIYVVPTFHNPTGTSTSARRRRRLADLAATYGIPVIEDDPYYDLRFEGDDVAPIASMDREGWVVYLGSFSKILAPGFRIGWAHGPSALIQKMALAKQGADLFTNGFGQRVAERYLAHGMLERHLPRIRALYRRKRDVMLAHMRETFPDGVSWTRPGGGMFLWVTIPRGFDTRAILPAAAAQRVVYVPGHGFFAESPESNHMRLNYSFPSEADIEKGIGILGSLLDRTIRSSLPSPPLIEA